MRQRLALAAALLGDPQLLILDEPLDGLDPAGQHAFRARLKDLAADGRTVVVSSHDLADVEALADFVVVVDKGRLVSQGPLEDLLGGGHTRIRVGDVEGALVALTASGLEARRDDGGIVVSVCRRRRRSSEPSPAPASSPTRCVRNGARSSRCSWG